MEACPLLVPIMMTTDGYPADIQVHKRLKFCSEYWLHAGIIVETIHLLLGDSQCKLKHLRFVLKLLKKKNPTCSVLVGVYAQQTVSTTHLQQNQFPTDFTPAT